ncbi:hypothetical protein [Vibrio vulnificus]|uniref:hypothetical protein n=1 Tax=Vibrio vulnificus TaxID=672 RepID=UPI001CDC9E40
MLQDRTAILFVITATIIGLCGAFFYPLTSLSVGIVGELFNYYSSFYVSLLGVSLALILLICCQTKLAASSELVPNSN